MPQEFHIHARAAAPVLLAAESYLPEHPENCWQLPGKKEKDDNGKYYIRIIHPCKMGAA